MSDPADLFKILTFVEADLRGALAKLTEVRAQLSAMNLPSTQREVCPECGLTFPGTSKLSEHVYLTHRGPEPAHWATAEARTESPQP